VELSLGLPGTSPFVVRGHRYISSAQVVFAIPASFPTPTGLSVVFAPSFLSLPIARVNSGGGSFAYNVTVNPLQTTFAPANAGEKYFSVNLNTQGTPDSEQVFANGVEFKVLTATFTGASIDEDSIKLLDVTYRFE